MSDFNQYLVEFRRSDNSIGEKIIDAVNADLARADGSRYGRVIQVTKYQKHWFIRWNDWVENFFYSIVAAIIGQAIVDEMRTPRMSLRHRAELLMSMSSMLRGNDLITSLSLMSQNFKGPIGDACRRLRYLCDSGWELIPAIREMGPKFMPAVTLAIIAINSKVGTVSNGFRAAYEFEVEMDKMSKTQWLDAADAVLWFWVILLFLIITDVWGWSLLESQGYFSIMPETGPAVDNMKWTRDILSKSSATAIGTLLIWSLCAAFLSLTKTLPDLASKIELLIVKIPIINGVMLNRLNFITCYQISRQLEMNVPLTEAFENVVNELPPGVLKDDLARVLEKLYAGDQDWVAGFYSFSDLDRALLKSSQDSREIGEVFAAQAEQFRFYYEKSYSKFALIHRGVMWGFFVPVFIVFGMLMIIPMMGGFDMVKESKN